MELLNEVKDNQILMVRELDAPRNLVWEVFTQPGHLANWWGPTGFSITTKEMSVQVGGNWILTMHGPDGRNYPNMIEYLEVVKPERIVFQHVPNSGENVSHKTTILLEDLGNKTKLTFSMLFTSLEELQRVEKEYGAIEGGIQTLGRLKDYLKTLNQ